MAESLQPASTARLVAITPEQSAYLDAWRGGSAIFVLIGHTAQIFFPGSSPIFGALAVGSVMAFFGLSGFFIHKSTISSFKRGGWRAFAAARVNRILPPFIACLVIVILLHSAAPMVFASGSNVFLHPTARPEFSLDGLLPSAVFLNGFFGPTLSADGPLWSLSYEVWYYAIALLAVLAVRKSPVGYLALPIAVTLTVLNKWFAIFGLIWLGGFVLSILHSRDRLPKAPTWALLVMPIAILAAVAMAPPRYAPYVTLLFELAFGVWFLTHMTAILRSSAPRIPFLPQVGRDFSYTLYVLHFPLLLFAYGACREQQWVGPIAGLAAFAAAWSVRGIEKVKLVNRRPILAPAE